jgi:Fe-S-cluster containining protein
MTPSSAEPRQETFGYTCRRCRTCCVGKDIPVNPYEVARLARRLGETTGEFRAARTRAGGGAVLDHTESGACIFLGADGCTVHADRPLACRLYPLGRHVLADGTEWFSRTELDAGSQGQFSHKGTIAAFLEAQGVAPFLRAADEYFAWICAAHELVGHDPTAPRAEPCDEESHPADDLADMDSAIRDYCALNRMAEPTDVEERKQLHLVILHRQLDAFRKEKMHDP